MKVLTLKQPWASLVANGYKVYEFRSWKTNYRGEILIHAGCGVDKEYLEKVKDYGIEFIDSDLKEDYANYIQNQLANAQQKQNGTNN